MTAPVVPQRGPSDKRRTAASAHLLETLFRTPSERRLPKHEELAKALAAAGHEGAFWACEMNAYGPLYFLPTQEWISATARLLRELGVERVLEVAAGDGFLSACLQKRCKRIRFIATDSGAWTKPAARMSAYERRVLAAVAVPGLVLGAQVERIGAKAAVAKYKPDLVLVSWAPPGSLVEGMIKSPVGYVLDIATDDESCGNGPRTWRFHHSVHDAPALCRLDAHARKRGRSRVALYYARAHEEHYEERLV